MGALLMGGMVLLYLAARSYAVAAADRSFDQLLNGSALSIVETLAVAEGRVVVDLPYAALDMLSAAPDDRVFYRVRGPDGRLVTGAEDLPTVATSLLPVPLPSGEHDGRARFFDADYSGERVRFAVLGRQIAEPGIEGWVWVQVGQTRRARDALSDDMVLNALAPLVAMTILALAIVWFGIGHALRPLTRIGQELANRVPSDLSPVRTPVPLEVAPVADSLNTFMARLDTNVQALQGFIAEAAHQMRTPLAALLAQAQVAEGGDEAELRRGLGAVRRNGARLTRLLNQLLSDATIAHRSDVAAFEEFDLLRTVRLAARERSSMADGDPLAVRSSLSSAPFRGDALMIGEAVKNLIDNAMTHGGAAPGHLEIALEKNATGYLLSVSDRGPGIPVDDRNRVFDRFVRLGRSDAPGAGLGLAIVRQAVTSHDGAVDLQSREDGGLTVTLDLPRGGS